MVDYNKIFGNPYLEKIVLASVPFYKLDSNTAPIANASGCIVEVARHKFLLSIAHSNLTGSGWAIENKSNINGGTILYKVGQMKPIAEFKYESKILDFTQPQIVDFTYRLVDDNFKSYHTLIFDNATEIVAERSVFKLERNYTPDKQGKYGFFGHTNFDWKNDRPIFIPKLESDLKFVGEEENFLVFELPNNYNSHKDYIGCSGAPIIDENNTVAALVSFGDREKNLIYGLNLRKYIAPLIIDTL